MFNKSGQFLAVFFLIVISSSVFAINPYLEWKTLESDHFRIHFHNGEKSLALKSAAIAELVHEELTKTLNWVPRNKTDLVLSDEVDFSNGAATPIPFNATYIFITPPNEPNTLEDYDDWLKIIIKHEYTHIIHLDKASGFPRSVRNIFGRMILFFPNSLQPNWLIEGLATHMETDVEAEAGRGQSSQFAMMMRTEVANGIKPVSQVNLPIRSWPGGTSAYLYGVYFYQFIEHRYGKDSLLKYIESNSNNVIPFRVNANTQQVFGKDMTELWTEFEEYLGEQFTPQLQAIQADGIVDGKALTSKGFRSGSPVVMSDGSLYFINNDGFTRPALMYFADNKIEHIADLHYAARLDMHDQAGALISQPEICDNYTVYYDLYRIAKGSNVAERLTHCARYVFSSWSPNAENIIAVNMSLGQSSLHRLNANGELLEILWQGEHDEVISQIDWSADGNQLVASVWHDGNWNLELFDVKLKSWSALTNDPWIQMQPRFSYDNKSVIFSADYDGVFNIHRLELDSTNVYRLTNVEGGAFAPSSTKDSLFYSGYGANGFDIYHLERVQVIDHFKQSMFEMDSKQKDYQAFGEKLELTEADYSPWSSLRPRWWLPSAAAATKEGSWLGAVTGGNDVLRVHAYLMSAAFELNTDTFSATFSYIYNNRLSLSLSRGAEVNLDAADDVLSIRLSNEFQLTYDFPFLHVESDWHFLFNMTIDEEFNDDVRTGITALPESKDGLVGGAILFDNSRQFNYSISPNDGRRVKLIAESSDALESDFSGDIYVVDWREYIQLSAEHVLAIRLVNAWGTEQPKPFRLGGVNFLSSDFSLFNKREYNLRGYAEDLAELTGRRMQLLSTEWRFPVSRIERGWMSPPLGISQLSGSVFYEAGDSWDEGSSVDKFYQSAGLEFSAEMNLFYGFGLKVRAGYAHGFNKVLGDNVVYFSIGSSF